MQYKEDCGRTRGRNAVVTSVRETAATAAILSSSKRRAGVNCEEEGGARERERKMKGFRFSLSFIYFILIDKVYPEGRTH